MSKDTECPYCGEWQEICHDDGYGYEEAEVYSQVCGDCDKEFVYYTTPLFYYEAQKADCLNGAEHSYEATCTYPRKYTKMRCKDCGDEREPTDEEMASILGA